MIHITDGIRLLFLSIQTSSSATTQTWIRPKELMLNVVGNLLSFSVHLVDLWCKGDHITRSSALNPTAPFLARCKFIYIYYFLFTYLFFFASSWGQYDALPCNHDFIIAISWWVISNEIHGQFSCFAIISCLFTFYTHSIEVLILLTYIYMICIFQTFWLNGTGGLADLGVARPQRHVDLGGLQPRTTITSAPTSRDLNWRGSVSVHGCTSTPQEGKPHTNPSPYGEFRFWIHNQRWEWARYHLRGMWR